MNARLLFVHALAPLHAGTGQGVGVIDLPVAREKATGLPFLPGSSIKGTLRDACIDMDTRRQVFGPETSNADTHAGSVQISDQRLLLLPVRSLAGTFAWVTSPYVLRRFARDAHEAQGSDPTPAVPEPSEAQTCLVAEQDCRLTIRAGGRERVVLEDLDLQPIAQAEASCWAAWLAQRVFPGDADWQIAAAQHFCVVHDDVLNFLLETATEITARIRMDEKSKTVAKGGLWYEEALPAETVLAGLIMASPTTAAGTTVDKIFDVLAGLTRSSLQFGGKATVGRGLCRVQMA